MLLTERMATSDRETPDHSSESHVWFQTGRVQAWHSTGWKMPTESAQWMGQKFRAAGWRGIRTAEARKKAIVTVANGGNLRHVGPRR